MNRGIYIVANDAVVDELYVMLKSVRVQEPTIPICIIPYDYQISKLTPYLSQFNLQLFQDTSILEKCDSIAEILKTTSYFGCFRKLVAWDGYYDEFILLDSDMILQEKLSYAFDLLPSYDILFGTHSGPEWVWKDGISVEPSIVTYNAGCFFSKKSVLNIERIISILQTPEAEHLISYLWTSGEQALLNILPFLLKLKVNNLFWKEGLLDNQFHVPYREVDCIVRDNVIWNKDGRKGFLIHCFSHVLAQSTFKKVWEYYRDM